ncbi:MAG: CoB--CoM heterodisulfide reductase iron-sulfur subunit B family protein [Clostridiales bacterium]|nr:CoB--CoM heterodisulfide reductase iron-sulfur subunit B family protein [Clostridiales bacterium]
MVYDYYPGCTLKNKASRLDISARRAAEYLGVEMREIPQWQCCGGVYPMAGNETAPKLPSVRALNDAKTDGLPLLTVCSACYHVMKSVNYDMKNGESVRTKANSYMELDPPYSGETKVVHYLEMLRDDVGFDELSKKAVNPLKNVKIAAYYGCMILRPSAIIGFDDAENPSIMENFIAALGAEPVVYPLRNECCGGYMTASDLSVTEKNSRRIAENAEKHGADFIITACPLCMYNLKKYSGIPVKYFTEPLCEALGIEAAEDE